MTLLFIQGYRDALIGDDFIKEDMPPDYYEGVAMAKREMHIMGED